MNDEEKKLKIVEMKKCRREVNKALAYKSFDALFACTDAYCVCAHLKEYMKNGNISSLLLAICMLGCYIIMLQDSRKNTEKINNNLDKEIDLEELLDKEELSK